MTNNFRTPVQPGTNCSLPADILAVEVRTAQINYFDVVMVVHQILEFNVSVDYVVVVEFFEALAYLVDDVSYDLIGQVPGYFESLVIKIGLDERAVLLR